MIGQPDVINEIRFNGTGEASLSMAGVSAAIASYEDKDFMNFSREKINQAKEIVENGLKSNGLSYLPSETNFILVNLGSIDADKFRDEMLKENILIKSIRRIYHQKPKCSLTRITFSTIAAQRSSLPHLRRGRCDGATTRPRQRRLFRWVTVDHCVFSGHFK